MVLTTWRIFFIFRTREVSVEHHVLIINVLVRHVHTEPFEVSSGDIVQFGVDVMKNLRKETHGCIVATLKLYLPDGRETKASQSTLVGATTTKIPQVDLYRLNQFIQEAVQREQNLENK